MGMFNKNADLKRCLLQDLIERDAENEADAFMGLGSL
jgi:hypothetical protein